MFAWHAALNQCVHTLRSAHISRVNKPRAGGTRADSAQLSLRRRVDKAKFIAHSALIFSLTWPLPKWPKRPRGGTIETAIEKQLQVRPVCLSAGLAVCLSVCL